MAFETGINYFFFYNLESENFLGGLKSLLVAKREQTLVAMGSENRNIRINDNYWSLTTPLALFQLHIRLQFLVDVVTINEIVIDF
ncbi:hypothetical protein [Nostoc sp. LEGE 12450]|uniref:hypothetical protein n=1 Tax=Nostoc sp. LEGE 12450 TaxID=1828643 RepID=UPI00187ED1C3|nr:hypothetical protein [Nostoc sp. LEGE 12450]MBE8992176.1 hypothetical protein [Nostoc sp. LEGE 12450]